MIYLLITNILNDGIADYKGLDIDKFGYNKCLYTNDLSACYTVTTEEEIPKHEDITIITEEDYNKFSLQLQSGAQEQTN